jgi:hypothetical protein
MSRLRSSVRRLHGWGLLVTAIVVGGGVGAASTVWLPEAAAAVVGSTLAAGLFGIVSARGTTALDRRARHHESQINEILSADPSGRLRRVREGDDPIELRVHPAATVERSVDGLPAADRTPPYVPRDIEEQLHAEVRRGGFVVVIGDSTAGKSRAAYEAMRTLLPEHVLLHPAGRQSITTVETTVAEQRRCVVWLDDLERFLSAGGLTAASVRNMLVNRNGHVLLLATMRTAEYNRFSARSERTVSDADRESWHTARDVLEIATIVRMRRQWSPAELDRANGFDDPRIRKALPQTAQFGLAEVLAAGPELVEDWRNAWASGTHPRGAALVSAAVDCRRAGFHLPLSLDLLATLAEHHLASQGGALLRPEPLDEALAWAVTASHGASSLLIPTDQEGHYLAFDYLIDTPDLDPIPQVVWETLVQKVSPSQAATIGMTAAQQGQQGIAMMAYRKADHTVRPPGLSPTFMMTTLNRINGLIRHDPAQARDLLQEFTDFASYSLRETGRLTILAEELRNVDRYLTLTSAFSSQITVRLKIAPEVLAVVVPHLILQPLVENAILHGISPKPEGGTVTVVAMEKGDEAEISVEDDGVGADPDRMFEHLKTPHENGASTSIANTNHRMRTEFGDEYALILETAPRAGMKVILRVPKFFPGVRAPGVGQ